MVAFRGSWARRRWRAPGRRVLHALATLVAVATMVSGGTGAALPRAAGEPLRVLLVGDEIMGAAGPEVVARLESTGRVDAELMARAGTGLASAVDWPAALDDLLHQFPADVVVAHFGGADSPPFATLPDGSPIRPGSREWLNRWGEHTVRLMDVVAAHGTRIAFVVPPPDADPHRADVTEMITLGQQGLLYGWPDQVSFIDPRIALSGPDGGAVRTVLGRDGSEVPLRTADGYGLAPEGAHRLATVIVDELTRQWCLAPVAAGCVPAPGSPAPPRTAPPGRPRVLAAGDSLLFQVAPRLHALLERPGLAWVHVAHRSTAGLLSRFYDWRGRIRAEVAAFQPDVVLLQFQGGYRPPYHVGADGAEILPATLAYYALFTSETIDLTAELRATGALVVWVLGPEHYTVGTDGLITTSPAWQRLADSFGAGVASLDGWEALGQAPGVASLDVPTSAPLRLPDRIHFTPTGAARYAHLVVDALVSRGCLAGPGACRS